MGDISKHFNRSEFACQCGCGWDAVDAELLNVLEDVRDAFSQPVTITSGNRCDDHNRKIGGAYESKHKYGIACDIKVKNVESNIIAEYLETMYKGKYGIGRYSSWTHIDVRSDEARWDNS